MWTPVRPYKGLALGSRRTGQGKRQTPISASFNNSGVVEPQYTTRELAGMLEVFPETIQRAADRGELLSTRDGYRSRYAESAVVAWLELLADSSDARPPS
jgi:excisionase family DNA binding protein